MTGDPRADLIATACRIAEAGLNRGTAGNLSVCAEGGFWITPSGMQYEDLVPDDVPFISRDGASRGRRAPSSEWRIHRDLYLARPDVEAVVHAHSPFAVAVSCLRREIPAFHYMVARFGGSTVPCSGYATFGTQALSDRVLEALVGRQGCLMANHGMIVIGRSLADAAARGVELEDLCAHYWRACALGNPVVLPEAEMAVVLTRLMGYGQP